MGSAKLFYNRLDKIIFMSYAVYHLEKGSISSGGIGNHIDRKIGAEHTYRHADPNLKDLNKSFDLNSYCSMPLHQAIEQRIKDGYKSQKAIRKDAVKYTTHILTGSHDKMKEIEGSPEKLRDWVKENKKFLEQEFGKENIVRFVLHRDEKTPHLHAVTVNLTADGRLSAKEIVGNRKDLQNRQDRYAQAMQSFGLERGIKNTGIKHEDAKTYYSRMKKANDIGQGDEIKAEKNILGIYKEESIQNLQNALKSQKTALKSKDFEIKKLQEEKISDAERKTNLLNSNKKLDNAIKNILVNESYAKDIKSKMIAQIGEKHGYDVRNVFRFVSHSIQQKTNDEIAQMVGKAMEKVGADKNLSPAELHLLMASKEVRKTYDYLISERERRNDLDQKRGLNKGRGI